MLLGREEGNVLHLNDERVSRYHAKVQSDNNEVILTDLESTNGTYLNEEQIARESLLTNGDRIKVGPSILKFLSGADAEAKYHEEIFHITPNIQNYMQVP